MNGIYFTQKPIEDSSENYTSSKFLGSPTVPLHFLDDHPLSDDDFFIAQINLEDLKGKQTLLPDKGFLYFFLDVDTLEPTVYFTEDEPAEVIIDINESFEGEYGATDAYQLFFDSDLDEGHYLLGEVNPDVGLEGYTDLNGKLTLLEIDALAIPEEIFSFYSIARGSGRYTFLIKESDLLKRDFSRVEMIDCEC